MKSLLTHLLTFQLVCLLVCVALTACGVTADRFPGTVVTPPVALAGQWQLTLGGATSTYDVAAAANQHYRVTQAGQEGAMDASIQVWRDTLYLVALDVARPDDVRVFKVQGATPDTLRIAALDPARTEAALVRRGLPVVRKKMWLHDEIALTGPALEAVLAMPPDHVFALGEEMTLQRVQ